MHFKSKQTLVTLVQLFFAAVIIENTVSSDIDIVRGSRFQLYRNVSTRLGILERKLLIRVANLSESSNYSSSSVSSQTYLYNDHPEYNDDAWFVEGILLKVLVFIGCAAGVFGVLSMCCIVCGWYCSSSGSSIRFDRTRRRQDSDILVWECGRRNHIYLQRGANETIIAFIPQHPRSSDQSSIDRSGGCDEINDLPPAYDDLSPKPDLSSPPPPPYTPSFKFPESR